MKRDELLQSYKLKTLLEADSGAGKTYACVKCAEAVSENGGKVLYLDVDEGAMLELLNLDDNALENITYLNISSYAQLNNILKKKAENYDLVIIDILYPHLKDWARHHVREALLNQGYYYLGEKRIPIDNPETFDLRGFLYSIANNKEKEIFILLRKLKSHIICTAYPIDDDKKNQIRGYFDIVFQIFHTHEGRTAKTIKVRANPQLENKLTNNYIEALCAKITQEG
ncbi:MAG: hypothetical protein PWP71_2615 [Clostridia bacterium]|nr:hypothetical protein [Clostridia bacterium]